MTKCQVEMEVGGVRNEVSASRIGFLGEAEMLPHVEQKDASAERLYFKTGSVTTEESCPRILALDFNAD